MALPPTNDRLVARPLDSGAFAPYGDVVEVRPDHAPAIVNDGTARRYDDLATLDVGTGGGRASVSIFRSRHVTPPVTVTTMECHPLGSQLFMPMHARPFLVVVAPAGPFDTDRLQAFVAAGGQGVNYHAGVWHHYLLALEADGDFLVIDRAGPGTATQTVDTDRPVTVLLPDKDYA